MAKRVAIVGGGITGLAAAYELERCSDVEIDLYEAGARLGGKLQTERVGNLLVESGPDCFFSRKPGTLELLRSLGMEDEILAPSQKEFSMLVGGRLHRVPGGLVTLTYSSPDAVDAAEFLSPEAKQRVRAEAEQPRGAADDESLRSFFDRRFGAEFTRLVVEPLLAGTHGGDPERLSMKALYPGYLALERKHGSLAGGMGHASGNEESSEPKTPTFLSLRGGMRSLVDALARHLERTRIHLKSELPGLPDADHVLLAIPANRAASYLPDVGLERIEHRSSLIFTLAYRRGDIDHPLNGTGFLVPPSTPFSVTGATWSSQKWSARAPEGTVLMRVFTRSGSMEEVQECLKGILGVRGEPVFSRVTRWTDAQPQYEVGHLDRVAEIEAALPPNVSVSGTSFRGVGIPDCIRQGRESGRLIAEKL